jgi:hypothetical protein
MTEPTVKKAPVKKINSKNKGSGFELSIAKILSETFQPLQFRRSQSSGAILGGKNSWMMNRFSNDAKTLFIGDIVPTNEADVVRDEKWKFRFTLECKFYKEQDSFMSLFKNPQIKKWFEQAKTDSVKLQDKLPMLVFKFNHTPVFAAFEASLDHPSTINNLVSLSYNLTDENGMIIGRRDLKIVLFNELLETPEWWKTPLLQ